MIQLLGDPFMVFIVLLSFALGVLAERLRADWRRQAWKRRARGGLAALRRPARPPAPPKTAPDAADQLRIVMGAEFVAKPLLNRGEARVFRELDRIVLGCNPRWQVMAQVSLGEILRSKDADAFRCVNAKRVDLLLLDEHCRPRHAIEYQGAGHHQGTAAARDAVKKEALRRAGVGYHEVVAGRTTPADLRRLVETLVDRPEPAHPGP